MAALGRSLTIQADLFNGGRSATGKERERAHNCNVNLCGCGGMAAKRDIVGRTGIVDRGHLQVMIVA